MSRKVLQVAGIANELEGASLYFNQPPQPSKPKPNFKTPAVKPASQHVIPQPNLNAKKKNDTLSNHSSELAGVQDSLQASMRSIKPDDPIETIRKTVKQVGKDTVFIRLTADEKAEIASIVYTFNELYRGDGRKTSENEIGRIALNFLLKDYRENGELSILARVLAALNA